MSKQKKQNDPRTKYFVYSADVPMWIGFDGTQFKNEEDAKTYNRKELIRSFFENSLGISVYVDLSTEEQNLIDKIADSCGSRMDDLLASLHLNNLLPKDWN